MNKEEKKQLQEASIEDLQSKLIELSGEQFKLRINHKTNQLDATHEIRRVRRDIARVKQVIGTKKKAG